MSLNKTLHHGRRSQIKTRQPWRGTSLSPSLANHGRSQALSQQFSGVVWWRDGMQSDGDEHAHWTCAHHVFYHRTHFLECVCWRIDGRGLRRRGKCRIHRADEEKKKKNGLTKCQTDGGKRPSCRSSARCLSRTIRVENASSGNSVRK